MSEGVGVEREDSVWHREHAIAKTLGHSTAQVRKIADELMFAHPEWARVVPGRSRFYSSSMLEEIRARSIEQVPEGWVKKRDFGSAFAEVADSLTTPDGRKHYFVGGTLFEHYSPVFIQEIKTAIAGIIDKLKSFSTNEVLTQDELWKKLNGVTGLKSFREMGYGDTFGSSEVNEIVRKLILRLEVSSVPDANRYKRAARHTSGRIAQYLKDDLSTF